MLVHPGELAWIYIGRPEMGRDMGRVVVLVLERRNEARDVAIFRLRELGEEPAVVLVWIVILVAAVTREVEMVWDSSDNDAGVRERSDLKDEHELTLPCRGRIREPEGIRKEFVCKYARPDALIILYENGRTVSLRMV